MSTPEMDPKVDLSRYSTGDYDPGPTAKRAFWLLVSWFFFESWFPWSSGMKSAMLRCFGAQVGDGVVWKPRVKIKYPWFLKVGNHTWVGEQVWIDNVAPVELGDHVVLSQAAYLLTGNHDYTSPTFDLRAEPVKVESGAWVAAMATVCPGATVGKMAVLMVNSVARTDLERSGVYSGNPAEYVRERTIIDPSES